MRIVYKLPYPPSANHAHVNRNAKVKSGPKAGKVYVARMLSDEALAYRSQVLFAVRSGHKVPPRLAGRLAVTFLAYPPDARARDMDNLAKQAIDALGSAGVFLNDSQIDEVRIFRGPPKPAGALVVSVEDYDPARAFEALAAAGINEPALDGRILCQP